MNAVEYVRTRQPKDGVRWRELEEAAWAGRPEVVNPRMRVLGSSALGGATLSLMLLWAVFALGGPAVALVLLILAAYFSLGLDLVVPGILFALSVVQLTFLAVSTLRRRGPERVRDPADDILAWRALVPAVLALVPAFTLLGDHPGQRWAVVVIALDAVVALALGLISRSGVPATAPDTAEQGTASERRLAARVARIEALPPAERDAVRTDLRVAISQLHRDGAISADDAERAMQVPLGRLADLMGQHRRDALPGDGVPTQ